MPELPEVETVRSQLSSYLPLEIKKISKSKNLEPGILHTKLKLKDLKINEINRIGKLLIFELSNGEKLLSHLGMTGAWIISPHKSTDKHTHLQFMVETSQGERFLYYNDPRRFGHLYQMNNEEFQKYKKKLGIDLLSPEFSLSFFRSALLKYPHRLIKPHLLDQKYFAGSGNYIANEVCARAKVMPDRVCHSLSDKEIKALHKAFSQVLKPAIKSKGVTFQGGYRDTTGEKGFGVSNLIVFYQKVCGICKKTPITKIMLSQRGTYYCPNCQK